jgi:peptide/nickel transport system ATP-binding protein
MTLQALKAEPDSASPILEVRGLTKRFPLGGWLPWRPRLEIKAVEDVSFALYPGRITALVGESGSGKSTVARLLARLYKPSNGTILFEGKDVSHTRRRKALRRYRGQVQMIFQDPFASLNPVKRVRHHIVRPLTLHRVVPRHQRTQRVEQLLQSTGLVPPAELAEKYPHQLSGGQRQRVAIARALAVEPDVLLADEPISMLDVSIRIGVLNLMLDLKRRRNLAFLYITHDIASARYIADEILVMYSGQVVEQGPTEAVLGDPLHPYTQLLLSAVPDPTAGLSKQRVQSHGDIPKLAVSDTQCRFVNRCPMAMAACRNAVPRLAEVRPGHWARCYLYPQNPPTERYESS